MGRHRPHVTAFPLLVTLGVAVLVAALVAAGAVYARRDATPTGNTGGRCSATVRVVTASSFAPVLEQLAPDLAAGEECVRVEVDVVDGRAAAARVAQSDVDVWIPDDASWVATAVNVKLAAKDILRSGTVLATSPIFMVTDPATAAKVEQAGASWLGLATLASTNSGVRLALRDPGGSGDGLVAAAAVGEGVWLAKGMDASSLALANALPRTRTVAGQVPALPAAAGEVGLVPEYALLPALPAGAAYLAGSDRSALLRYTWLPTATAAADPERGAALNRLVDALRGTQAEKALAAARLRGADGLPSEGAAVSPLPGVTAKPFDVFGAHHIDHVFATWYPADRRTSLLVVIDVSGSMADPAPGTATPVIELVRQGCLGVAGLLPDDAWLGLWEFGSKIAPPVDYRTVLPPAPLTIAHRAAWTGAVGALAARNTGTGLYDTILAAYVSARDSYVPDIPNHVFVFTDGLNEDQESITIGDLTGRLAAAKDPARPVRLSIVAFGQPNLTDQLKAVVKPVDGYVGAPTTAEEVAAVFIHVSAGGIHN
jgi:hypothetical protein